MTTSTNAVVAKLSVAFVAIAMMLSLVVPANAQTTGTDLQAEIDRLLQMIATLEGQLGTGSNTGMTSTASVCPFTWTRDLSSGATGADVMALQQFLNSMPETQVAPAGSAGGPGMETSYFGPATGAAVAKFQMQYRTDILSPLGLVNPTQYFGAGSRAKANALCTATIPTPTPDDGGMDDGDEMDDEDMTDEDDDMELSGNADLDTYEIDDAEDEDIEEGRDDQPVAEITIQFEDGDALVDRLELQFDLSPAGQSGNGAEDDAWDTFEAISLWLDGDKIAEVAADDEDDWRGADNRLDFNNLDLFAEEDEEYVIVVAASVQNGLDFDSADDTNDWRITLASDSLRFEDASGFTQEEGPTGDDTADFDIEEEGSNDELDVRSSDADPSATTLPVEDDSNTEFVSFAFDFDAEDSDADIEINQFVLGVDIEDGVGAATNTTLFIDDIRVLVDGDEVDTEDVTVENAVDELDSAGSNNGQIIVEFDNNDFVVGEGERVTVEIEVEYKSVTTPTGEGALVVFSLDGADVDAEGANDLNAGGSATGDQHTLRTEGIIFDADSFDSDFELRLNSDATTTDDQGIFEFSFDVEAFETDVYINDLVASGTARTDNTSAGIFVTLRDTNGKLLDADVEDVTFVISDSTADQENNGLYEVNEGSVETFTVRVDLNPLASGSYRVQLEGVAFRDDAGGTTSEFFQAAQPRTDFDTPSENIQGE